MEKGKLSVYFVTKTDETGREHKTTKNAPTTNTTNTTPKTF
jgi:hypothetical protein